MCLTHEQIKLYEDQGYLFLPGVFTENEVEIMKTQLPKVFRKQAPGRSSKKQGKIVRSVYGLHRTNEVFNRLSRHPRLVETAMQLVRSGVYIYQFKVNAKSAFGGDIWDWHQDFIFWQKEDSMLTSRVVNAAVLLDEMTEFNGPIFLIPGSHVEGVIDMPDERRTEMAAVNADPYSSMPAWITRSHCQS